MFTVANGLASSPMHRNSFPDQSVQKLMSFCAVTQFRESLLFQRNTVLPSSGSKKKPNKNPVVGSKVSLAQFVTCFCWFHAWLTLQPLKMEAICASKMMISLRTTQRYSVTTQKTVLFIVPGLRSSEPR
jgi:hypothetical protein